MMQKLPDELPVEVSQSRARHYIETLNQAITRLSLPMDLPVDQEEARERHIIVAGLRSLRTLFEPIAGEERLSDPGDELLRQVGSSLVLVLGFLQILARDDPGRGFVLGAQREAVTRKLRRFEGESDD